MVPIGLANAASLKPAGAPPCQKAALKGKTKCRLHGGLSTGPRTPECKARAAAAHTKHRRRSKAQVAQVKAINAELRRITNELKRGGWIP